MGIIHVLDKHTANLIAAGEVVERPASAVKEMLENCADAGATAVTVEIKDGGTSFIRITDNGCGMTMEDVRTSVLRHATSKIKTGSDLDAIGTLGFRGEALAAITAVSKVRFLTKRAEDMTGTLLDCKFGEIITCEEAGCPNGTTIIVEDIFENTPARRKFLKKNSTEATAVLAVCEKFALSKPDISVKLISDGSVKLQTPGDGKLKNAVYSAVGREFANAVLPLDYEYAGMRAYGFIGKPEVCRPNRNMQNFFVNGRYVKSRTMMAALEEGFRGFCPSGKFPSCVIFISVDLRLVDVNIHPAKLEIKFSDERNVFDTVYFAVRNALSRGINANISFGDEDMFDVKKKTEAPITEAPVKTDFSAMSGTFIKSDVVKSDVNDEKDTHFANDINDKIGKSESNNVLIYENLVTEIPERKVFSTPPPPDMLPKNDEKTPENVGISSEKVSEIPFDSIENGANIENGTKILIYEKSEITQATEITQNDEKAVSSHESLAPQKENPFDELKITQVTPLFTEPIRKAPERVEVFTQSTIVEHKNFVKTEYIGEIFDTYLIVQRGGKMYLIDKHAAHERIIYEKIKHASDNNDAQYLLEPISVTLTATEFNAVSLNKEYFTAIGFDFDEFGDNTYLIRSQPNKIDSSQVCDVFTFLAGKLAEGNSKSAGEIFDRALYTASCRAAIKGGNKFTESDNKKICEEIFTNEAVLYCPHGRPILIEFTKEKIEKMFGRI